MKNDLRLLKRIAKRKWYTRNVYKDERTTEPMDMSKRTENEWEKESNRIAEYKVNENERVRQNECLSIRRMRAVVSVDRIKRINKTKLKASEHVWRWTLFSQFLCYAFESNGLAQPDLVEKHDFAHK